MAAPTGYLTTYPGAYLSEQDFAVLIDGLAMPYSAVINGCIVTINGSTLSLSNGRVLIRGRVVKVTAGTIECPFSPSGTQTKYLVACLKIYGSDDADGKVTFLISDTINEAYTYDTEIFNYVSGGTAYCPIAELTVTANTITAKRMTILNNKNYVDNRVAPLSTEVDYLGEMFKQETEKIETRWESANASSIALTDNLSSIADGIEYSLPVAQPHGQYVPSGSNILPFTTYASSTISVVGSSNNATYTVNYKDSSGTNIPNVANGVIKSNGTITRSKFYSSYNGEQLSDRWLSDRDICYAGVPTELVDGVTIAVRFMKINACYDEATRYDSETGEPSPYKFETNLGSAGNFIYEVYNQYGQPFTDQDAMPLTNNKIALFTFATVGNKHVWKYVAIISDGSESGGVADGKATIYYDSWDPSYSFAYSQNRLNNTKHIAIYDKNTPAIGSQVFDLDRTAGTITLQSFPTVSLYQGQNTVTVNNASKISVRHRMGNVGTFILKKTVNDAGEVAYNWEKEE